MPVDGEPEIIIIDRPIFYPDYACHVPGVTRLTEALASLSAFICIVITHYGWYGVYVSSTVSIIGFTASFTIFLMHLFHMTELTSGTINWIKLELIYSLVWGIATLLSIGFVAYGAFRWRSVTMPWGIASVCLLIASICYFLAFRHKLKEKREDAAFVASYNIDPENPKQSLPLLINESSPHSPVNLSPLENALLAESPRRFMAAGSLPSGSPMIGKQSALPEENPPSYDSLVVSSEAKVKTKPIMDNNGSKVPAKHIIPKNEPKSPVEASLRKKSPESNNPNFKAESIKNGPVTNIPVVPKPEAVKLPTKAPKTSPKLKKRRSANLESQSQSSKRSSVTSITKLRDTNSPAGKAAMDHRPKYARTSSTPTAAGAVKQLSVPKENLARSVSGTFKNSPTSPMSNDESQYTSSNYGGGSKNNLLETTNGRDNGPKLSVHQMAPLETAL